MIITALALLLTAVDAPPALVVAPMVDIGNGRIACISVAAPSPIASIAGSLAKMPLIAFPASGDGTRFIAMAPLDIEWRPSTVPLVVDATLANGMKLHFAAREPVVAAPYQQSKLTIDKQFIVPSVAQRQRAAKENRAFDDALAHPSKERLWRGSFMKPVPTVETSPFGTKRTYMSEKGPSKSNRHYGWDLNGAIGDPIVASNRGRIALAADRYYSGGTVLIDHGQGLFTMYFHMSRIDVREGDLVEKGQQLGSVGNSGQVTGPHLHFALKFEGFYQDAKYLVALDLNDDALISRP
ncbi:MAG TPA: M23 family metallopeptidase [Myxococcota bacterium]|jgi:murein DD-endopeptidase MepM/ murein hydrolase activator NlpD